LQAARVELREGANSTSALKQAGPARLAAHAERREQADARDDCAFAHRFAFFLRGRSERSGSSSRSALARQARSISFDNSWSTTTRESKRPPTHSATPPSTCSRGGADSERQRSAISSNNPARCACTCRRATTPE